MKDLIKKDKKPNKILQFLYIISLIFIVIDLCFSIDIIGLIGYSIAAIAIIASYIYDNIAK
jgi:hypothetical protein